MTRGVPNGVMTACSYEYINNPDGTVTQTWKTCTTGCPQNPQPQQQSK
jgi:hypothetical protein